MWIFSKYFVCVLAMSSVMILTWIMMHMMMKKVMKKYHDFSGKSASGVGVSWTTVKHERLMLYEITEKAMLKYSRIIDKLLIKTGVLREPTDKFDKTPHVITYFIRNFHFCLPEGNEPQFYYWHHECCPYLGYLLPFRQSPLQRKDYI